MTDPLEILKTLLREKAKAYDPEVARSANIHIAEIEEQQRLDAESVADGSALVQVVPLTNMPQGEQ